MQKVNSRATIPCFDNVKFIFTLSYTSANLSLLKREAIVIIIIISIVTHEFLSEQHSLN